MGPQRKKKKDEPDESESTIGHRVGSSLSKERKESKSGSSNNQTSTYTNSRRRSSRLAAKLSPQSVKSSSTSGKKFLLSGSNGSSPEIASSSANPGNRYRDCCTAMEEDIAHNPKSLSEVSPSSSSSSSSSSTSSTSSLSPLGDVNNLTLKSSGGGNSTMNSNSSKGRSSGTTTTSTTVHSSIAAATSTSASSSSIISGGDCTNNNNNNNNGSSSNVCGESGSCLPMSSPSPSLSSSLSSTGASAAAAAAAAEVIPSWAAEAAATWASTESEASTSSSVGGIGVVDSEPDDNEMGRLQALLEARGLPPHLFSALGPRVHHLLHRSMGNKTSSRAHQLISGLQATGDEGQQLQAVMEMCQLLVMGNEDTLAGFPTKQAVPALIGLLRMEQNFDIMNHSCRALTYMMESLPRSSAIVVDAIPAFLEKLQFIQCMDVAEQSLTALEMLSRRHSKAILHAGGVPACLSFLDFFTINAQRAALSITANCCQNLTKEEFSFVKESVSSLGSHLVKYQDKKCLESLCLAFSRLIESFQHYPEILEQITENNLLSNVQQLLLVSPSIISTGTFVMVIRMLATMCASCPQLAVQLLKLNISDTIRYLLVGSSTTSEFIELTTRSPQELYEITSLIGELMPKLPTDGIFSVDGYWMKQLNVTPSGVSWQWKDDRGMWHNYSCIDSKMMEAAHLASEDEISLTTMGRTYVIDFNSMQQINEDTGTSRLIQRLVNNSDGSTSTSTCTPSQTSSTSLESGGVIAGAGGGGGVGVVGQESKSSMMMMMMMSNSSSSSSSNSINENDARIKCLKEEPELAEAFIRSLFGVLYEVYSSSAGPSVRHKCIRALLRIIYYSSSDLLRVVLKNHAVSSHIAAMLPSSDVRVVVGAIQMVYILMDKLPDIFSIYFRREGVIHQLKKLISSDGLISGGSSPISAFIGASASASLGTSSSTTTSPVKSSTKSEMNAQKQKQQKHQKQSQCVGPSTSSSGALIGQSFVSTCYLEAGSPMQSYPSSSGGVNETTISSDETMATYMNPESTIPNSDPIAISASKTKSSSTLSNCSPSSSPHSCSPSSVIGSNVTSNSKSGDANAADSRSSQLRLSDVLKRKRSSKKGSTSGSPPASSSSSSSSSLSSNSNSNSNSNSSNSNSSICGVAGSIGGTSTTSNTSSNTSRSKNRSGMDSLSMHLSNCINSPSVGGSTGTGLGVNSRGGDYDPMTTQLNSHFFSTPYLSMPFFSYSGATGGSPSSGSASVAPSATPLTPNNSTNLTNKDVQPLNSMGSFMNNSSNTTTTTNTSNSSSNTGSGTEVGSCPFNASTTLGFGSAAAAGASSLSTPSHGHHHGHSGHHHTHTRGHHHSHSHSHSHGPTASTSSASPSTRGSSRSSSKLSSAAAKTSSFFANLYPARWRRWNSSSGPNIIGSGGSGSNLSNRKSMLISQSQEQLGGHHHSHHHNHGHGHHGHGHGHGHGTHSHHSSSSSSSPSSSHHHATHHHYTNHHSHHSHHHLSGSPRSPHSLSCSPASTSTSSPMTHANGNKEKIRVWIREHAKSFVERYFTNESEMNEAMSTLNRINEAMETFSIGNDLDGLREFKEVLLDGDISPFELIHCGIINKLTDYLSGIRGEEEGNEEEKGLEDRNARIRRFLHVFLGSPIDDHNVIMDENELKLDVRPMSTLIAKLNACISQLEQFPVRVHDVLGTGNGNIRGTSALKFFNTHQLKCNLQRHRECTNLKQWRGGTVKIDPLALVQAIERYLLLRGYGRVKEEEDDNSDDDNSDDDFDDTMASVVMNQGQGRHKIQFLIDDNVLPYNMTVYQAIRQFSGSGVGHSHSMDGHDMDNDFDAPMGNSNMWVTTHTIYYRAFNDRLSTPSTASASTSTLSSAITTTPAASMAIETRRGRCLTRAGSVSAAALLSDLTPMSSSGSPSTSSLASNLLTQYMSYSTSTASGSNNVHSYSYSSTPLSPPTMTPSSSGISSSSSGRRSSKSNKASVGFFPTFTATSTTSSRKKDELWTEGRTPRISSTVYNYLIPSLPKCVNIEDCSLEVMNLMRILNALNRCWSWFYNLPISSNPAIMQSEFVNNKLTAKANRQLQDPLVIMTGNLPQWLSQIAYVCPFLFPFETRHLLFYITSFDRDRALQRLLDTTPGLNSSDTSERVTPRLDKRKKTVTREDILRQAESVFHDIGNSKALLEIQYENEVGTGLGPTLEFYALVSKEMQRADLDMWRGEAISSSSVIMPLIYSNDKLSSTRTGSSQRHSQQQNQSEYESNEMMIDIEGQYLKKSEVTKEIRYNSQNQNYLQTQNQTQHHHNHHHGHHQPQPVQYIYSSEGLFPSPVGKSTKTTSLSKIKSRYRLLGKFMAKALSDSRMIDLPLSIPFYKWILGEESTLNVSDMHFIDATLAKSVTNMFLIAQKKQLMERGISEENHDSLTLSGVSIEDLHLDFTLPGFPGIELRKGGKDMSVTLDNIDQYLRLMVHWTMVEGVSRQMEAFKEGFESVLPLTQLQIFYPEELEQLFCGSSHQSWDLKTLIDCCHPDHGYTYDSRAIKFLFEVLSSFNSEEQRKFLQFVTGSPRLPVGGLKSLSPPLTVVRKTFEPGENPDNYLPSVMTCVNYLKLPDYSNIDIMREKLIFAANEGQHSFHLS